MGPINLYETGSGDFAPASSLTADESVALHRRGVLAAIDYERMSIEARAAVGIELRRAVAARRYGRTIFWGCRVPTRVYHGRA